MNRVRGIPDFMDNDSMENIIFPLDDDSIKLAAEEYLIKEMEKKARREKQ